MAFYNSLTEVNGVWNFICPYYQEKLCAAPGPGVASVNLALHLVCSFTIVVLCLSGVCVRFVYPNTLHSCLHSSKEKSILHMHNIIHSFYYQHGFQAKEFSKPDGRW